jgi:hypothetical protein
MKKLVFTACAVGLGLTANLWAQVPSYVQKNGLVGWWPFNGNANDESGNGNNGTVNGATLTTDRFGNAGKAYSFDGIQSRIWRENTNQFPIGSSVRSISVWLKIDGQFNLASLGSNVNGYGSVVEFGAFGNTNRFGILITGNNQIYCVTNNNDYHSPYTVTLGTWHHIVLIGYDNLCSFYLDNIFLGTGQLSENINTFQSRFSFGNTINDPLGNGQNEAFNGSLDDIGIWNRALSQQEITALFNSCGDEITSQPTNANLSIGTDAQFSVGAKSGSSYQWQSNPLNLGWQNISNNSTYSGATSNKLTISSTSVSSHNQPFRAIVNSSGCIDTSIVAKIIIGDTCLSTVTDTLIINTTLSLLAPNNENTILIYPNPASDHITIDNGNFSAMAGYSIKITNNAGQQVFQSTINQQQFYVDLSTWSGNGLYSVHLIDPKNKTVTVRKIVLQ